MKKNFVSFVSRPLLVAFCFVQFLGFSLIVNPTYVSAATEDTVAVSAALEADLNQHVDADWKNFTWTGTVTSAKAEENGAVKLTGTSTSAGVAMFGLKPTTDGTNAISSAFLAGQKSIITYRAKVSNLGSGIYFGFMNKATWDGALPQTTGKNYYAFYANQGKYNDGDGGGSGDNTQLFAPTLNGVFVANKWYRFFYVYDNTDNINKYLTTYVVDEATGQLYIGAKTKINYVEAFDSISVYIQRATAGSNNVYMDNVKIYRPGAADSFAVDGVNVSNSKNLIASFTDPVLPFLNNTDTICLTNDSTPNASPASITITEKDNTANTYTVNSFSSPYLEAKDWTKTNKINIKLDTALTPGTYTMTFNNFKNINGTALSSSNYDFIYTDGQSAIKLNDQELYNWRIASGYTATALANVSTSVSGNELTLAGGGSAKSSAILSSPYYPDGNSGYMRDYWGNGSVISFRFKSSGATADKAKFLFGFADRLDYGVAPDKLETDDLYQILRFDQTVSPAGNDVQYTDGSGPNTAGSTSRTYDSIASFVQDRWYKVVLKWTAANAFTMYVIDENANVTESKDITITNSASINFDSLVFWNLGGNSTVGQTLTLKDVNVYKISPDIVTKDTVLVKQGYGDGVPSAVLDTTKEYDATKWNLSSYNATNNLTTLTPSYTDDAVKIRWDGSSAAATNGAMSVALIKNLDGTNLNSSFFTNSKTVIQYTMKYINYTAVKPRIMPAFVSEADYDALGTATTKEPYWANSLVADVLKYNTGNLNTTTLNGTFIGLSTLEQDKWYTFTYVLDQTGASRKLTTYISDGTNSYTTGERTIGSNYDNYNFDSFMLFLHSSANTTAFYDLYLKNFKIFKPSLLDVSQYNIKSLTLRNADNNGSVLSSIPSVGTSVKSVVKYTMRDDLVIPGQAWDSANSLTYQPKILLAFFNNTQLLNVQITDVAKPITMNTTTTTSANIQLPLGTTKVKAFSWTDTLNMVPITTPELLQ